MRNISVFKPATAINFCYTLGTCLNDHCIDANVVYVINDYDSVAIQQFEDCVIVYHFENDMELRDCANGKRLPSEVYIYCAYREFEETRSFSEVVGLYAQGETL